MNRRNIAFVVVALLSVVLDQASKYWVFHHLTEGVDEISVIPGFFSLVHRQNPGAAFGFLGGYANARWVFMVFSVVAVGFILDMLRKARPDDLLLGGTLGLVFSGAIGNAIDRVLKATVTDFLKVYTVIPSVRDFLVHTFGTNEWPSFNVADSALVVGVALYLVHQTFLEGKKDPKGDPNGNPNGDPKATTTPTAT